MKTNGTDSVPLSGAVTLGLQIYLSVSRLALKVLFMQFLKIFHSLSLRINFLLLDLDVFQLKKN